MHKITCDYCSEDHIFEDIKDRPDTCTNCNSPMGHLPMTDLLEESDNQKPKVADGMILTFEKTGESINIPHQEIIILGRQNTGSKLFSGIPQISREHCKIEFFNKQYLVTDLGSLNGTYLGTSRRDCLKYKKQALKENDLLHLGRETLMVTLKYRHADENEMTEPPKEEDEIITSRFKCKGCGKIHDMNLLMCDECGSYGEIEALDQ